VITLYQKKRTGKVWQWSVYTVGSSVITTYGYVGGAQQSTTEVAPIMNAGKRNQIAASDQAILVMIRKAKDKIDNGYVDTIEAAEKQDIGDTFTFEELPVSFCPAKPISSIERDEVQRFIDSGIPLIVQRKFDGMCHFAVSSSKGIAILSRAKLENKTLHVPHVAAALRKLPVGTILNGELCVVGDDDFTFVSSVLRTKGPAEAIKKQQASGNLHYIIFDVLFWNGEDVTELPYENRLAIIEEWLDDHITLTSISTPVDLSKIYSVEQLFGTNSIQAENGWEGLVIWNARDHTEIRWDGKEARRNCYKWKTTFTEDVYVEDPQLGNGKNKDRLGKLTGYQYHNGEKICVGDIGGGFSDEQRIEFWENRDTMFPCVVEVETAERLDSMKLRFPVFIRMRPDKMEKECTVQLMPRNNGKSA
jgi:ATP-dependent DNA ligase